MAGKGYLKNPYVLVDGHDFSSLVKGVTPHRSKAKLPVTASGDNGDMAIHGLSTDSFSVDFYQDKDLSVLDRILSDLYEGESTFVVEITPAGSTVSESNPSLTANCKLFDYTPYGGQVGSTLESTVVFDVQGVATRAGT